MPLSGATMTRSRRGPQTSVSPSRRNGPTRSSSSDLSSIVMRQLPFLAGSGKANGLHSEEEQQQQPQEEQRTSPLDNEDVDMSSNGKQAFTSRRGIILLSIVSLLLFGLVGASVTFGTDNRLTSGANPIGRRDDALTGAVAPQEREQQQGEEDEEEKNVLMAVLDHPALLVIDISILVFSHGILGTGAATKGVAAFVQRVVPHFKEVGAVVRGGSKLVTSVLLGPLRQNTAAIRRIAVHGPKQAIQGTGKFIRAVYKNRSWYSTLGDYTWYLDAESKDKNEEQQVQG